MPIPSILFRESISRDWGGYRAIEVLIDFRTDVFRNFSRLCVQVRDLKPITPPSSTTLHCPLEPDGGQMCMPCGHYAS